MSILQDIRIFWQRCPVLQNTRIELDALAPEVGAVAVQRAACQPVLYAYTDRSSLCKARFSLLLRLRYRHELALQAENDTICQNLEDWGRKNLPELAIGEALELELTSSTELLSATQDSCVLRSTWELWYVVNSSSSNTYVNGMQLANFGARLRAPQVESCPPIVQPCQPNGRSTVRLIENGRGLHTVRWRVDFFATSRHELSARIAALETLFAETNPVELSWGDGYQYRAVLMQVENASAELAQMVSKIYTFRAMRHGPLSSLQCTDGRITCLSSFPQTDCRITIKKDANLAADQPVTVMVDGQQWRIAPPIDGNVQIDAMKQTITVNGQSCLSRTEWKDFPYLHPGTVSVSVKSGDTAWMGTVQVDYEPTYL